MAVPAPALAHHTPPASGLPALAADAASLIGVVLAVPFVILAVGAPLALVVTGLLWAARALQNAF